MDGHIGVVTILEIIRIDNKKSGGRILISDFKGNEIVIPSVDYNGSWKFVSNFLFKIV